MKLGLGSVLLIIVLIVIASIGVIFYLQNNVNIKITPIFWRVLPNYKNIIAFEIVGQNNGIFPQDLNVTIVLRYVPPGTVYITKYLYNSTVMHLDPHKLQKTVIYIALNGSPSEIEIGQAYLIVKGLYGYSKQLDILGDLINGNSRLVQFFAINDNQFPVLDMVGSFTPSAPFNYSLTSIFLQYNYSTGISYLYSLFRISPYDSSNYLQAGNYNITFRFLNYSGTFPFKIIDKNPVSFYLISPIGNYNITIIISNKNITYDGFFTITVT